MNDESNECADGIGRSRDGGGTAGLDREERERMLCFGSGGGTRRTSGIDGKRADFAAATVGRPERRWKIDAAGPERRKSAVVPATAVHERGPTCHRGGAVAEGGRTATAAAVSATEAAMQGLLDAGLVGARTLGTAARDIRRRRRLSAHDLVRGRPRVQPVPTCAPAVRRRSVPPSQSLPTPSTPAASPHPATATAAPPTAASTAAADAATAATPPGTAAPEAKTPAAGRLRWSIDRPCVVVVRQPSVCGHVVTVLIRVQPLPVRRI